MEQRLLGQDVTVRVIRDGTVVSEITAVGTFGDSMDVEIKDEGFLGRTSQDFSEVFDGYSGDLEFQTASAGWTDFAEAVRARAQRADPGIVFNVVRSDQYASGDSSVFVYHDVAWGQIPTTVGGRKEFAKIKLQWKCSERTVVKNQLL